MKRILTIAALALVFPTMMTAVPAMRGVVKTLTLKDGTKVEATLVGDENVHYYKTSDGRCLQKVDGAYEYVSDESLRSLWEERLQSRNDARRTKMQRADEVSYTGSRKGLVILVSFADLAFETEQEEWNKYFNEVGYSTAGMWGSVHDYFLEQSYGVFDLSFDVVGPVTVSNGYSYYGSGNETNVPYMVKEACQLVDSQVNFKEYDWDEDGYVDQVYLVYAGYGEAQGADEDTIWPHEWGLSGNSAVGRQMFDGVWVDTYACSSELHGNGVRNTGVIDGIGTACHEFSHCLGLPDFYDTANNTNYGMDVWSLLDYGNYNGDGYVPAAFTAYERYFAGWLEYTELEEPTQVRDMPCLTDEPFAYVIRNDNREDEYYLLQNIQNVGFNSSAYGHGLLIMHVDYNGIVWSSNTVNAETDRQRMTIFAADNTYGSYGRNASGDPFPGTSDNYSFTDYTAPASILYTANKAGDYFMSKPIENISESEDGLISFDFMGGVEDAISAPFASEATTTADAAVYDLSGRRVTAPRHGMYIQNGRKVVR